VKDYDFDDIKQNQQEMQSQIIPSIIISNNQQTPTSIKTDNDELKPHNRYIHADSYYANPSKQIQYDKSLYHRTKRYLNNLEDLLHQEMITQDDNNLNDCQCRVIRGIEECKDCDLNPRTSVEAQLISTSDQATENYMWNNYSRKNRFRRDVNEKDNTDYVKEVLDSTLQNQKIEKVSTKRQTEASPNIENEEASIDNNNKSKELIVSSIINIEDPLKIKIDNDEMWNRLPRKIEPSAKFVLKSGETFPTPAIKISLQNNEKNNSAINDYSTIKDYTSTKNETETSVEHAANIRSVDTDTFQRLITSPLSKTLDRATFSKSTRFLPEKSSVNNSKNDEKLMIIERDNISNIDETTITSVTNNSTTIQNVDDTKSINTTSININGTSVDFKTKQKNNSAIKIDERIKSRQTRLTTRAEALAALKKENESRRAKKMIETSMKIIDLEKSKFAEYQKRRHDQIERLKRKLRAKREKMLQQYRSELLEVINESSETKESNIHRRDLLKNVQTTDCDDMISDSNKLDYVISYSPIQYILEKESYKSGNKQYIPIFKKVGPYNEINSRQVLLKPLFPIYLDDHNNNRQINKDKKRSTLQEKLLGNENSFNTSNKEKSEIKSQERSPYSIVNTKINNHNIENLNNFKGNENKHYSEEEKQQPYEAQYYPHVTSNEEVNTPLYEKYNQQPLNIHQSHKNVDNINSSYSQETSSESFYKINFTNAHQIKDFHEYDTNEENVQEPTNKNNYYKINKKITPMHQVLKKNIKLLNIPNYEDIKKELIEKNYHKAKKSNLRIFEINPSLYEDNESNYSSSELLMKPSYQFSSKNYGHDPYKYTSRRYKRGALNNEENLYKPLYFSLGLDKSKMISKKSENIPCK
jgi:hypothetical protein